MSVCSTVIESNRLAGVEVKAAHSHDQIAPDHQQQQQEQQQEQQHLHHHRRTEETSSSKDAEVSGPRKGRGRGRTGQQGEHAAAAATACGTDGRVEGCGGTVDDLGDGGGDGGGGGGGGGGSVEDMNGLSAIEGVGLGTDTGAGGVEGRGGTRPGCRCRRCCVSLGPGNVLVGNGLDGVMRAGTR